MAVIPLACDDHLVRVAIDLLDQYPNRDFRNGLGYMRLKEISVNPVAEHLTTQARYCIASAWPPFAGSDHRQSLSARNLAILAGEWHFHCGIIVELNRSTRRLT